MPQEAPTTFSPALRGTYQIDTAHSRVGFAARHAMVTKVRGSFNDFEGTITLDPETPSNSKVEVVIQVASVDTRQTDRDGHLRTNDFFDVPHHPTITFTSTDVVQTGPENLQLTGDLTIRGVTKSVTLDVEFTGSAKDPYNHERIGFEASATVKRSDFGMTFNAVLETGGVMVSDKATIEIEVSAIKTS